MLSRRIELLVRLASIKISNEAAAMSRARPNVRASLVSGGLLTVEELESLPKREAMTIVSQRLTGQM